jgi:catechol 2,3-dioxygenase-like lactoylglutathione lyase family enzyme
MIDHLSLQCSDPARSAAFYDAHGAENREVHVAFTAADRGAVEQFHRAAVAQGMEVLHEPRVWEEYHPNYYAVFVRDPDGNNVEAVCHTA